MGTTCKNEVGLGNFFKNLMRVRIFHVAFFMKNWEGTATFCENEGLALVRGKNPGWPLDLWIVSTILSLIRFRKFQRRGVVQITSIQFLLFFYYFFNYFFLLLLLLIIYLATLLMYWTYVTVDLCNNYYIYL